MLRELRESDNTNKMITISDLLLMQSTEYYIIWDVASLGQFGNINQRIDYQW